MQSKVSTLIGLMVLGLAGRSVEAADRPQIVELGDGRFQLALDPAVGTETPDWLNGAIEWEYAGQATYVREGERGRFEPVAVPKDDGPTDTITRLLQSEMEDEHGRLFRVKSVDVAKLQEAIDEYEARVELDFGLEDAELCFDDDLATDPEPEVGDEVVPLGWNRIDQDGDGRNDLFLWDSDDRNLASSPLTASPVGWNRIDQDGDGVLDQFLWGSDDRTLSSSPLTARMKKAVVYFFGDVGSDSSMCTGILIGSNWVLTAAGCAKNSSGTAWIYAEDTDPTDGRTEAKRGKVCTRGNFYSGADCANVTARWSNGNWGGSGDLGDNLVVMKIDEPLGRGNYMALSRANNSTIKSYDNYNIGHPNLTPGGAINIINCPSFSGGDPFGGFVNDTFAPCESRMFWSDDEVNWTSTKVIGTKIDMSVGHAGGPIYYYPSTGGHYLTGIAAGHHNAPWPGRDYNGGPKIRYHRSWIIGIMSPGVCRACCDDGDVCTFDREVDGECTNEEARYGDVAGIQGTCGPDGVIDIFDIFGVLDAYQSVFAEGCELSNIDLAGSGGSCGPDGVIDIFDVFAVLDAYQRIDNCCSGLAAIAPPDSGDSVESRSSPGEPAGSFALVPSRRWTRPGDVIDVDVYVSGAFDLRGYQVSVGAGGGRQGTLELIDAVVNQEHADFVFGSVDHVSVADMSIGRLAAVAYDGAAGAAADAYLGTFTFRVPLDASGSFRLTTRPEQTHLFDSLRRPIATQNSLAVIRVAPAGERDSKTFDR